MYLQLIQKTIFIFLFFTILISSAATEEVFLSLKKSKVNVRYGPSFDSDIKYVYKKINLPIKQIDKKENFRRIIDLKNKDVACLRYMFRKFQKILKMCRIHLFFGVIYQVLHN